ncbi:hypothetical protein [Bacillus sp. CECT 9360]|uniref:WD40/YVTN/BNR-like repeat-containing protein n=1 Tax=Bacillus sp. CECT 9360 TaxID=2845821 RepID=UPI001E595863|nr:hypothetical protein [Bacillus sp. CECT 9360]CAH0346450.1 hypothetical protein BCI9360_02786 [Bacillus sp. CECT 9360]
MLISKRTNFGSFLLSLLLLTGSNVPDVSPIPIKSVQPKYPVPGTVQAEILPKGDTAGMLCYGYLDKDGALWGVGYPNIVRKSVDKGDTWTNVLDATPQLEAGDSISMYGMIISDTGRIIVGSKNGKVLVSDEAKTAFTVAFQFASGYTQNTWGYAKHANFILMSSYGTANAANPPREVYFSKDNGAIWSRIFNMPISDMSDPGNFHIHDVTFDPYSDCILVVTGDGSNRQIYYSYDYGTTWKKIFNGNYPNGWAPLHPTSLLCFPHGIIMGSDEKPEGLSYWRRPTDSFNPDILEKDIIVGFKKLGFESDNLIGHFAVKGWTVSDPKLGNVGLMAFQNHLTSTKGYSRLLASPDGFHWYQIFKETDYTSNAKGFFNVLGPHPGDEQRTIYGTYSRNGKVNLWRAKLPVFQ